MRSRTKMGSVPISPPQKAIVQAFLVWLNRICSASFQIIACPDTVKRTQKEIDYLAQDSQSGRKIAIEASTFWRREEAGREDARWLASIQKLKHWLNGQVPGTFRISTPIDWSLPDEAVASFAAELAGRLRQLVSSIHANPEPRGQFAGYRLDVDQLRQFHIEPGWVCEEDLRRNQAACAEAAAQIMGRPLTQEEHEEVRRWSRSLWGEASVLHQRLWRVTVCNTQLWVVYANPSGSRVTFARILPEEAVAGFTDFIQRIVKEKAEKLQHYKVCGLETWLVIYHTGWTAIPCQEVQAALNKLDPGPLASVDHLALVAGNPPDDAWVEELTIPGRSTAL